MHVISGTFELFCISMQWGIKTPFQGGGPEKFSGFLALWALKFLLLRRGGRGLSFPYPHPHDPPRNLSLVWLGNDVQSAV